MSKFCVTPVQALLDTRLSLRDFSVLAALGMHTDKVGWCFPSQARLGRALGITQPAINQALRHLRECGYVQIVHQFQLLPSGKKQQIANNTRILFDVIIPEEFQRKLDAESLAPGVIVSEPTGVFGSEPEPIRGFGSEPIGCVGPEPIGGISSGPIGGISSELIGGISSELIPLTPQYNDKRKTVCPQADTHSLFSLEADPKKAKDAAARNSCYGFDDFWKVYPRHEGAKKAKEAWIKRGCAKKAEKIIADVRQRKARHGVWLEGIIPHPATYINGERWNDDITPPKKRDAAESMF